MKYSLKHSRKSIHVRKLKNTQKMKYWKSLLEYLLWKIKKKFGLKKKKHLERHTLDIKKKKKTKQKTKKQQLGRLKVNISIWPAA